MSNIITVAPFELKAFVALSKVKPTKGTTHLNHANVQSTRVLLVDVSGKCVKLSHTNGFWFVSRTFYLEEPTCDDGFYVVDLAKVESYLKENRGRLLRGTLATLDVEACAASFIASDFCKGKTAQTFFENYRFKGTTPKYSTFDYGLLHGVSRWFHDMKRPYARLIYPVNFGAPLSWDSGAGAYFAILMPCRGE